MSDINNAAPIDLGSAPTVDFYPWADEDELNVASDTTDEEPAPPPAEPKAQTEAATPQKPTAADNSGSAAKSDNPLEDALNAAEAKDTEKATQNIYAKPPVFEFAGAKEDIADTSQTFDELRIAKAVDFPELDDGKRVTWTVEYGKINKEVSNAKGTSIAKMKSEIEASKEFLDALKKAKDKNLICKVRPRVKAQNKGTASGYKGVFTCMEDVDAAGKVISFLPARDGKVYEVRKNPLGKFITPVVGCELLSDVKAGFTPAVGIPRIPMDFVMKIIAFFRYFTKQGGNSEALVNIYWDSHGKEFLIDAPSQFVSKISVHSEENPEYLDERYIHYMDIHSHNSMRAVFSSTDNKDEKATRLYTVIGRLDKYFPEIRTRISNGGKFLEIDPSEVFEYVAQPFPPEWKDNVKHRAAHKDDDNSDAACAKGADKLAALWDISEKRELQGW